jgi:hypothetical protein
MNEAVITFVLSEPVDPNDPNSGETTISKVVRVEFEGSSRMFLTVLNDANGTMHDGWAEAFNVVAMEALVGQELPH